MLILFKYLIELSNEAIWSGLPLLEVFWLLIQSPVIGLFTFSISLLLSLGRLYVSIIYLVLLESAICWYIIFKIFSYEPMYFCSVGCSASSFTYNFIWVLSFSLSVAIGLSGFFLTLVLSTFSNFSLFTSVLTFIASLLLLSLSLIFFFFYFLDV